MHYFITGTSTDAGKTYVTCLLLRALTAQGTRAVGFKPVTCGGREDAIALRDAGTPGPDLDLNQPHKPPSCAPWVACVPFAVHNRLQIVPDICHGKPVIRGTRVLVSTVLRALAGGDSIETILEDYPNISRGDVQAALKFASRLSDYEESSYDAVA